MEIQGQRSLGRSRSPEDSQWRKTLGRNGKFIAIDPNVKTSAMALLAPLVHSSLLSYPYLDFICLYSPGAPQHSLVTTVVYRDPIGELKSLGCTPDERQTAHSILKKIPSSLASIRDSIISTGQTSTVVTYDLVLNMLDNKAKTLSISAPLFKPSASFKVKNSESDAATALLTYKCKTDDMIPRPTMLRDNAFPSTLTS
ncbi:hypothetical protein KEM48_003664 [Puccinia striiformis f. sp. tritici PST-130]|nr:hypothetical protein KEM48_003664 [Puccinia striiformis f. sp. tritici PST-130]